MIKKQYFIILISILFVTILAGIVNAFLLDAGEVVRDIPIGMVDIELDTYYVKDNVEYRKLELENQGLELYSKVNSIGNEVYLYSLYVEISDPNSIKYIENLRIDFKINSSVNTYFRVGLFESIIVTYVANDITYESSRTQTEFLSFNYNDNFYDNRVKDSFFYYKSPVKADKSEGATIPKTISFIGEYDSKGIGYFDEKYFLKLAIIFEAVQSIGGPVNNWGMAITPWNEEW